MRESFASIRAAWRTVVVAVPVLAAIAVLSTSCGASDETPVVLGKGGPDGGGSSGFDTGDGGDTPGSDSGAVRMCPTDQCPPGRATCADKAFPCEADLRWDDFNCGACGNICGSFPGIRARSSCVEGACVLQCDRSYEGTFSNCNGIIEDGCEINTSKDIKNCGACGNACGANEECIEGVCTCAIYDSCGACGRLCPPPTEPPFPYEWNAGYHCAGGECNKPSCNENYDDCNKDFPLPGGNGCETYLIGDPANCGGCGVVCKPGEECFSGGCRCPCGSSCFNKLDSDPLNCGACNVECQQLPGVEPVCNHGICEYPCLGSYADCDGRPLNGCETRILDDPNNCGGCGIRCDGVEGQACVEGRCTMKECRIQ